MTANELIVAPEVPSGIGRAAELPSSLRMTHAAPAGGVASRVDADNLASARRGSDLQPDRAGVRIRRRRRVAVRIAGSLATAAALAFVVDSHRHEFADALASASIWILAASRRCCRSSRCSRAREAWHLTIEAAGGTVARRVLYRASAMQVLGGVVNGHLGVAVRIGALRRSSPEVAPQVPTLIAAEFPILAVEAALAALTSFTLIGPLGLPWWLPLDRDRGRRDHQRRAAPAGAAARAASSGRGSPCCAARAAAAASSASSSSPSSRRSSATGCSCTRSA